MADIVAGAPRIVSRSVTIHDPAEEAFWILRIAFTVAPIVAGLDKYFHMLVNWDQYLAPVVSRLLSVSPHKFMLAVGAIEIVAGIIVAIAPRIGGWIVAAWLLGIIVNLIMVPGYYDVALRDLGLMLAAIALARLADSPAARTHLHVTAAT